MSSCSNNRNKPGTLTSNRQRATHNKQSVKFALHQLFLIMQPIAAALNEIIDRHFPSLKKLQEPTASKKPAPEKWSKKEIIGHMIDSSQSNIRRFIIGQYEDNPHIVYQ